MTKSKLIHTRIVTHCANLTYMTPCKNMHDCKYDTIHDTYTPQNWIYTTSYQYIYSHEIYAAQMCVVALVLLL